MADSAAARPSPFEPPKTVSGRIRYLRMFGAEMTQAQLAHAVTRAGVPLSRFMLNRIETDQRRPTLPELLGMAQVLGVTLSDLGVTAAEYPEIKFLKEPETRALLEATPS